MTSFRIFSLLALILAASFVTAADKVVLTEEEKKAGWVLLFDGTQESLDANFGKYPKGDKLTGWGIEEGAIAYKGKGAGDIITKEQYDNFELELEWKISPAGNSGIFIRAGTEGAIYMTAPECQVLDDDKHGDGKNPKTSAGSLYALIACSEKAAKPVGEWNKVKIVANGKNIEHWLNDKKVVSYEWGGEETKNLIAASKFKGWNKFMTLDKGFIGLQDHGNPVWFRAIKVKPLAAK
jgi:Domain of Unknown Function (DUF1080)